MLPVPSSGTVSEYEITPSTNITLTMSAAILIPSNATQYIVNGGYTIGAGQTAWVKLMKKSTGSWTLVSIVGNYTELS